MEQTAHRVDGPQCVSLPRWPLELDAHLIVVYTCWTSIATDSQTAERTAATILYDESPDAGAEARGEIGDVAERWQQSRTTKPPR